MVTKKQILFGSFYMILIIFAVWHLWSLQYSPIVWYDEIVFAGINHSIISGHGFIDEVQGGGPAYTYGPVYFLLTALSTKTLGFGLYSFRLVNLLFSFVCIWLTYLILRRLNILRKISYILIFMLVTDALFVEDSHSGRMECVALAFALTAYYWILKKASAISIPGTLCVSLSLTLSFMTTPRAAVILLPAAIYELWLLYKNKKWWTLTLYVLLPIILYSIWVFFSYGSYEDLFLYYTTTKDTSSNTPSLFQRFVGGNFHVRFFHYPIIILTFLSAVYSFLTCQRNKVLLLLCPVLLFYFIVKDTGDYATIIIPFYIMIVGLGLNVKKEKRITVILKGLIFICIMINMAIFTIKAATIVSTISSRNSSLADDWIASTLPKGASVTGSDAYFYSCAKNKNPFVRPYHLETKKDIGEKKNPQYLILADEDREPWTSSILPNLNLRKISEFKNVQQKNVLTDFLSTHNIHIRCSYTGVIYEIEGVK